MYSLVSPNNNFKTVVKYGIQDIDIDTVKIIPPSQWSFMLLFDRPNYCPPAPIHHLTPETTNLFPISINFSFQQCCGSGIIQYVTFWGSIFTHPNSLDIDPGFFHVSIVHPFLLLSSSLLCGYTTVYSSIERYLSYLIFGVKWIKFLWIFMCRLLCR